jgi:hypothetical protein
MRSGYVPRSFSTFGLGLNLAAKVDALNPGEAVDALNVLYTEQGAVYQRDGYAAFTSPALSARAQNLEPFYQSTGTKQLLAGATTRVDALNTSGGVVASSSGLTAGGNFSFARFGAPGSEYAYAGNGFNALLRWNGSAWTAGTAIATVDGAGASAMPKAATMDVMAVSNRLVVGGFGTATGGPNGGTVNPSTVYFSGDTVGVSPERWLSTNFIQVTPGDGEAVQAIISWREFVFIFKETKFFVVYGEHIDQGGNPVFDYRVVNAGVGAVGPRAVCASQEGVYFVDRTGVFRTTGSEPERVSTAVAPIFDDTASPFYEGGALNTAEFSNVCLHSHNRRIYMGFTSGTGTTNDRTLVFDPIYEWWTLYDIPMGCIASFRIADRSELVFGYAAGSLHVGRHSADYTDDAGTAITSRWRSGFEDYTLSIEKTIRESKAWGTGKVYLSISHDFEQESGTLDLLDFTDAAAPTWGTSFWGATTWASPHGLNPKLRRRAVRGTVFSTGFFNSTLDQSWSVHRLAHALREQRIASVTDAGADNA